jgi:glycosyltransferase involved in cell wall biosynthesis
MNKADGRTLAVIAPTSDIGEFPLGPALSRLADLYEVWLLGLRSNSDVGLPAKLVGLEDLGLPAASIRFALDDADLMALAKPSFLGNLATMTEGEITFVDGHCLPAGDGRVFSEPMSRYDMEIVPVLPRQLAATKAGFSASIEAGLGEPTGSVLRLRSTSATRHILDDWRNWMEHVYAYDPTRSIVEAELSFLRALPGWQPSVGWSHEPVIALWSDLQPGAPSTRLLDTTGFSVYQDTAGLAYPLMERRTHSGRDIEELSEKLHNPWAEAPLQFRTGAAVQPLARRILRAVDPVGVRWPDPAMDEIDQSYRRWLKENDSRHLPRFAQALYWARPDLQISFPAPETAVPDFVHWLRINDITIDGGAPVQSPPENLTKRAARVVGKRIGLNPITLGSSRETGAPRQGVNLVGFASAETGLGEAMRGTLRALRASGHETAVLDFSDRIYARQRAAEEVARSLGTPYDVSIYHLNPTELIDYADDALAYRMSADRQIGFFFWETEKIPDSWVPACHMVDEIWVASTYLRRAFAKVTDKPIRVMGMPVEAPPDTQPNRGALGLDETDFVVAYVTDAYSGLERKDPRRAIRAFDTAFGPEFEGVHLLLKIGNLEKFPGLRKELQAAAFGKPVTIVAEYLNRGDLWSLLACSDVYLSLHASEGFGLTILEAMTLGVPSVVTAYGGNLDFNDSENSLLVGYGFSEAQGGPADIYRGNGMWADPHTEEAASHLMRLRSDKDLRRRLGAAARLRAAEFSFEKYKERISQALSRVDS